ncbi:mitochondrial enolase superfamily member 1 isoform X2 [Cricetulus griseus]|uniref:Mitochondrial enolase superfamily member 1 n=1 Tax=Cricetulus griseus TaxID=10029 RepID=A0A9J7GRX6_CRIGR|nr:mitochondrial enolase superfamily member 1 isoform X2 [Cricetulus griseus]XP_035297072.1 mitochondrial enolase superfamily member 1 isoform X2 [Cricetulus griseus]
MAHGRISRLSVHDVRFPTSLSGHGSDAMHTDPDYSAAYVIIETDAEDGLKGYGITFTLGKGTEVVVCAVNALAQQVLHKDLSDIVGDFRGFYRQLTSDGQLRWLGPEKGVVHLATAAILNAVWDLWAKQEGKPLWKLLVDMDPQMLLSCIDFRYITDVLTEKDAYEILKKGQLGKKEREEQMLRHGYPAYTTSCAWLGYSDSTLKQLCAAALKDGWTRFKVKVGADLQDDIRRCRLLRDMIGPEKTLMMDANQCWDVPEAVEWMAKLAEFKPLWIEEPTSPDDILGHAAISKCHNRVIFKQLLQANALQFLQIDSCRLGSVNENLSVLLMAKKFGIPVCPHAGGVGLCELVQHLIIFDYISVSASLQNRMCEYVDHLHEHFKYPVVIKHASYLPPKDAGYSTEMKEESVKKHQYPDGEVWKKLLVAQDLCVQP